jgi:nucleoside-diphosphate-sugar epimerase
MQSAPRSTVLVTGGGGFIGTALIRRFMAHGWRAIGCGRRQPAGAPNGSEWRSYDLAWTALPDELFENVDALVHAAVVKENFELNVEGGTLLLEAAQRRRVKQIVFISSLAAHERAASQYGRQKYVLERLFESRGALVVRPGLVLGDGGLFASICAYLSRHRLLPLIGGGKQPLQTVFVDDLTEAIYGAVTRDLRGTFTVAERKPVPYREFYQALCARLGTNAAFVPIPFWAADLAVQAAALLRIRLPIDRDNLLGLRAMQADYRPRLDPPEGPVADFRANIERSTPTGTRKLPG